jgi:hypothetical protein
MSPDQIITADILAGLTQCPFCGADVENRSSCWVGFKCWTTLHAEQKPEISRSTHCERNELSTLRARVSELEAKVNRLIEAGDRLSNPFNVYENDIKGWIKAKEST